VDTEPTPDERRVLALQAHMDSLRREIGSRLESQNTVWRALVGGLAAVIILKEDVDVDRFLPLVPLLGTVLITVWLNNQLMIVRGGYSLGLDESKIGQLFGDEVMLEHEATLWRMRKELARWAPVWWLLFLLAVAVQFVTIYFLWRESDLPQNAGTWLAVYGAAFVVSAVAGFLLKRLLDLFKRLSDLAEPHCLQVP
jgi:hypothetical protein